MIVLDCSAAMALFQHKHTPQVSLIDEALAEADFVLAPELFKAEIVSANRKLAKAGIINAAKAVENARTAVGLIDVFSPLSDYYVEALAQSMRLDHSPYDLFYLLLAKRNAARLLTLDKALGRLCDSEGVESAGWD